MANIGTRGMGRLAKLAVGAAVLAVGLAPSVPASAASTARASAPTGTYLALGDSVAFGYIPPNAVPPPNYLDPSSLVGYPEDAGRALRLSVANASCPGETTGSMIAVGAQSNGCENSIGSPVGYRTVFPLHVKYANTQLAYAIRYLASHPNTQLVTIDVGANDAFICQATTADHCFSEFAALLNQVEQNLKTIYTGIREAAHYQGNLVALSYYSTTYTSPLLVAEVKALNSAIAKATKQFGGIVANGFQVFKDASLPHGGDPCAAGLLIKLPDGTCNIHPSPAGHLLLAGAIAQALGQ
jgi:lysophospholipase L1-like esterase